MSIIFAWFVKIYILTLVVAGILADFALQATLFAAFLALDARR